MSSPRCYARGKGKADAVNETTIVRPDLFLLRVRSLITFEFAMAGLLTVPPKLILNEP